MENKQKYEALTPEELEAFNIRLRALLAEFNYTIQVQQEPKIIVGRIVKEEVAEPTEPVL